MGKRRFSAARVRRMHEVMAGYVERGEVPGLVTLLYRGGELQIEAYGSGTIGGAPMRRDSIFRIASMSKPVTAAAAMILVEECRLRLDEPLDRWLPELAARRVLRRVDGPLDDTVPAQRPLTLRDLLTFRMGFGILMLPPDSYPIQQACTRLQLGQGMPAPALPPAPDEWLRRLGTLPLMFQPGERWSYHTGSDVLGVLIARASGQAFEVFLQERLFAPLGMRDTAFCVPADKLERFTTCYRVGAGGALEVYDAPDGQWSQPPAFAAGGAGLVATAEDFLAFGRMLLELGRGPDGPMLARPSVELMTSDQLSPAQKAVSGLLSGYFDSHGWGFGLSVVTRRESLRSVGSYGWDGGLGTSWCTDPAEDLVGVLLTQRCWTSPDPPPVCKDFWTLAYQALED